MADNVTLPGTGSVVASDEVTDGTLGTVQVQFTKLMDGTLNSTNKLAINAAGKAAVIASGEAASGAAVVGNPVLVGGSDGTNARTILADSSGRQVITGQVSANTATSGNPILIGAHDGTNAKFLLCNSNSHLIVGGAVSDGSAVSGNPTLMGGSDGTNARTILTDTAGRLRLTGQVGNGTATSGNPMLIGGHDSTNARFLTCSTSGVLNTQVTGPTGTAMFPSAAAAADALANPTVTQVGAANHLFNGSTWDLQRGMSANLTTGDTGAKTATGNGATQTNVGNKGLLVVVNMGAVSGTSPTCIVKLQGSVDGGTTWVDIPNAATASLTGSGVFGIMVFPGATTIAGAFNSGTCAVANAVMPRTWRAVWVIGGTTPSFTITNIQYNYLPN